MLTHEEYWSEVADQAAAITASAREDERDISEVLWEVVDSHEYVIYTAKAQALLALSPNDGAFVDSFGSDGLVKDGCLNWAGMAYCAMEADIRDHDAFDAKIEEEDDLDDDGEWDDKAEDE